MDGSPTDLRDCVRTALRHAAAESGGGAGRTVVACSGGADSVALLYAAREAIGRPGELLVAHLDHGLRADSGADAAFVADLAARLGVECAHERRAVEAQADESPEEAARRVRYDFLADVCRLHDVRTVLTAHHGEDQAETLLLNMMRGTGIEGLRGMTTVRALGRNSGAWLVRPFLEVRRAALEADLRARGQEWREDPTNRDGNLRASVRHRLVPLMRDLSGRDPVPLLLRLMRNVDSASNGEGEAVARCFVAIGEDELRVLPGYERLTDADRRAALVWGLQDVSPDGRLPSESTIRRLDRWLCGDRSELPAGFHVQPDDGGVQRVRTGPETEVRKPSRSAGSAAAVALPVPGTTNVPTRNVRVSAEESGPTARTFLRRLRATSGSLEILDADRVRGSLTLRPGAPDERFVPLGQSIDVRLAGYLARRGVPAELRTGWPVVTDASGIVWVVGHGIADRVKLGDDVERILILRRELP